MLSRAPEPERYTCYSKTLRTNFTSIHTYIHVCTNKVSQCQYLHNVDIIEVAEVRIGGAGLHSRGIAIICLDDSAVGAFLGFEALHARRR